MSICQKRKISKERMTYANALSVSTSELTFRTLPMRHRAFSNKQNRLIRQTNDFEPRTKQISLTAQSSTFVRIVATIVHLIASQRQRNASVIATLEVSGRIASRTFVRRFVTSVRTIIVTVFHETKSRRCSNKKKTTTSIGFKEIVIKYRIGSSCERICRSCCHIESNRTHMVCCGK